MSKRPFLKFYPSDWRAEPSLRIVSLEARGLWIEMLCLMHEAEPYGHLKVRGVPVDVTALAALVGAPEQSVRACLHELEDAGVLSRNREGVILSRRMIRDAERAARDRNNGAKGGNPRLKTPVGSNVYVLGVNPPDNPPDKGGVKAHIPEAREDTSEAKASSVSKPHAETARVFEELWKIWPSEARKRHPQQKVRQAIAAQLRAGANADELIAAGRAHVAERLKSGPNFVKGLVPWLNGLWRNWAPDPTDKAAAVRIFRKYGFRGDLTDADIAAHPPTNEEQAREA